MELPREQQLFYSLNGSKWQPSLYGVQWSDEKCEGYLHKHLTWDEFQAIANPEPSTEELFTQELSELNTSFESDVKSLSDSMANAMLTDGVNEQSRIDELRARYAARKAQHDLDELELMQKYGLA